MNPSFWKDKTVFLTGHTGFKGGWIAHWLYELGAAVHGYSLEPPTQPNFFTETNLRNRLARSTIGDIRDIAALAEVIIDARRLGRDIGAPDILAEYERWRRFDNMVLAVVTDVITRVFSNDVAPLRVVRSMGLGTVNRIAPLRRNFMRHAMGTVGDLPRLVRGEAL